MRIASHWSWLRWTICGLILSLLTGLILSGRLLRPEVHGQTTSPCRVVYRVVDQWPGGFKGDITVTNNAAPINGWTLDWTFPSTAQQITQLWNGAVTQTRVNVVVRNLSYNNLIPTNGSVNFGFLSNWSGTNPLPT